MPSTVAEIFAAADIKRAGVVKWGMRPALPTPPAASATGIYVVALTDQVETYVGARARPPISGSAVERLLAVRPELRLDGTRPTPDQLVERLAAFWFSDEVIIYIGLAGPRKSRPAQGELAKRVGEYCSTPLGARGPHAGGWPLKTLVCLSDLHVHYAYCEHVDRAEGACIGRFAEGVSQMTRSQLRDAVRVMPFANLEFPRGTRKNHGIEGARAPKRAVSNNDRHDAATIVVRQRRVSPARLVSPRGRPCDRRDATHSQ